MPLPAPTERRSAERDEADRDLDSTFPDLIDVLAPSHLRVLLMLQSTRAFAAGRETTVPLTIDRSAGLLNDWSDCIWRGAGRGRRLESIPSTPKSELRLH